MYKKLNITENHLRILSLFTKGREYYIREIERLLEISPRTAQLILYNLEAKGVLESETKGKIRMFKMRNSGVCKRYLVFAEQYKLMVFLEKKLLVREILEKISPLIEGIGIVFGSYAKETEGKESDLDVFVAGECRKAEIKKISETYGVEISIKCYPLKIFEKNFNTDILLKEIQKNHIVFKGSERFVGAMLKNG